MQPQAEQVVGLLRPLDEFLQLVEDVTVKEPEQGPVDMQGVGRSEAGPGEQGQDTFEGTQSSERTQREGRGQGAGDQQRNHVRVVESQSTEIPCHRS